MLLTNIRQFSDMEIILLFTEHDFTVPAYFRKKYGCGIFTFTDRRDDTSYIPSVRPWLLWQYFNQHPAATAETYFYIDSDIVFREWPDFATLDLQPDTIYGADCSGYLSHDYLATVEHGPDIIQRMVEIAGITTEQMKGVPGIGAQLVFSGLPADFWERSYRDSNAIYHMLERTGGNVQKWTAEMWAQLWGWVRENKKIVQTDELAFCLPTDDIKRWDEVKILHNAGVTGPGKLFFKGQYDHTSPLGKDFNYVPKDKCSSKYVEAMAKVIL